MSQKLQFEQAVTMVYSVDKQAGCLLLTEDGTFHHLDPEGAIIAAYNPMTYAGDAEYFQPACLQNGKHDAFALVHAPDSFLVIVDFGAMITEAGYEPDLIDVSEYFGTMGFDMAGSPDGRFLALYRTDGRRVLLLSADSPEQWRCVELPEPPCRIWLSRKRLFAAGEGNRIFTTGFPD